MRSEYILNKSIWILKILSAFLLVFLLFPVNLFPAIAYPKPDNDEELKAALKCAQELFYAMEEEASLDVYLDILKDSPEQFDALWNASFIMSRIGFRQETKSAQMSYYEKSLELAEKVLELYPDSAESNYVKAVALGRISHISGNKTRAKNAVDIKNLTERAIEIDPEFAHAYHLLGVWHKSVANLSGIERFFARLFFSANIQEASNEEAEQKLKKAIELEPRGLLFKLELARFYEITGKEKKAVPILREILQMDLVTLDDIQHKEEAEERLRKLQS
ncbi:MAG: hypothetical protein ACFCU6_11330 [Balneolaceae bacterium]